VDAAEAKKPGKFDFCIKLENSWMPYWEEYEENMQPELRSFNWMDHSERLWMLERKLKHEAYRQWMLQMHFEAREQLPEIARQLERNAESKEALERDRKLELLREMEIVGMTTTAVSKYHSLLKALRPEVLIVEEAAEVLEAHIVTALHRRTQHVILIGDHQQLRPSTTVYRLSKDFGLDVSLFERLIKNGADHVTLLQQRRMHPKISRLIKPYYPELRDHSSTYERREVLGVDKRTFFLKHNHLEDHEGQSHSKSNTFEANFVSALCAHLVKSGYEPSQITVLAPYLGQVRLLKDKLRRDPNADGVLCYAVDNYQGEENDIIILSLVRSNRRGDIGFVAVENRINVALTRARCGMYIVGNADMLRGNKLWTSIIRELQTDDSYGERMPLLEYTSGGVFEVKNADDISCLLDDPSFATGGEGETSGGFAIEGGRAGRVAERWAGLGKDERPSGKGREGKGRVADRWAELGKGDRPGRSGKGGDRRDRGYSAGADYSAFNGGSSPKDDRPPGKSSRGGGKGSDDSRWNFDSAERKPKGGGPSGSGTRRGDAGGDASGDEDGRPRPPPPDRMEASGEHPECELVRGKDADDANEVGKRAGKKSKKAAGNKVVMRWG